MAGLATRPIPGAGGGPDSAMARDSGGRGLPSRRLRITGRTATGIAT